MNSSLLLSIVYTSLALFIGLTTVQVSHAFPDGATVCTVGVAAPQDTHRERGASITGTGPLGPAGFKVSFNGIDISTLSNIKLNSTILYLVEVAATTALPFKGVLMIVSKPTVDTTGVFSLTADEGTKLKISTFCSSEAKSGVTHRNSLTKTIASATMSFKQAYAGLKFDVNIVVQNNVEGSYFYHDQYTFDVIAPASTPVAVPVIAPSAAPITTPVVAPVDDPVITPVTAPVIAPTVAPTTTPVTAPVVGPVDAPVTAPVTSPTSSGRGCGLFGLSILCPFTFCGFFGRLILGLRDC